MVSLKTATEYIYSTTSAVQYRTQSAECGVCTPYAVMYGVLRTTQQKSLTGLLPTHHPICS